MPTSYQRFSLVDDDTGKPYNGFVSRALATNRGAVVGTTSVELMPVSTTGRSGYSIQNQSTTATIYVRLGAPATADFNAMSIPPLGYFETSTHVGQSAVNVIATAASTSVFAREW